MRRLIILLTCVILVGVMSGCDRGSPPGASAPASVPASQPTVTLPRVDLEGLRKIIAETAASNRVLVIDFWATWCEPCVQLFPGLHEGVARLGPRVRIVTVTLDAPGEDEANAMGFLKQQNATTDAWMLVPEQDARLAAVKGLGKEWNNLVVPAILIYDRRGRLAGEFLGESRVEPMLKRVRELTEAPSTATQP